MKGSWTLVASVLAVSTAALSSTTYADRAVTIIPCLNQGKPTNSLALVGKEDKYSPRFDGLKFIETLITAHSDGEIKFKNEAFKFHFAGSLFKQKTKSRNSEFIMGENESSAQHSGLSKNTEDPWEKLDVKSRWKFIWYQTVGIWLLLQKMGLSRNYLKISQYADGIHNQELTNLWNKAAFGVGEKLSHGTSETSDLVASQAQFVGNTMKSPMFGVTTLQQATPYTHDYT